MLTWPALTRRNFSRFLALPAVAAFGQGISTRNVTPARRGKPSGIPFHAHFTDVAEKAGLRDPVIYGGTDSKSWILETAGCGAAFIDYDNDGWIDIFILSGTRVAGAPEATNRLYRNNRDGTFTDVTRQAGLARTGWASSVAVGDYNNDGFDDLFVTYWGQNVLYRNNGDGTFTDVTENAGLLRESRWGSGCAFLDYNRDGYLDLFVANYLKFDFSSVPKPGANSGCNWQGVPVACGPRGLTPDAPLLFRNNGDGTFTDVSVESGVAKTTGSYMMTVAAADFDDDGWPDIYVACDSSPSFLLRNNRDGTFTDIALGAGVALNEDGQEQAGMGLGIGDFDLDGRLDILKTHFADDTSVLYRNSGHGSFDDVTASSGLAVETRFVGWGAGIVDLDNNGYPDLFIVTGGVYPEVAKQVPRYPMKTPRLIFRNLGNGKFEELLDDLGPAISDPHCSRGCAFGDFDNDGDVDILIINLNEPPSLLRNDVSGSNRSIKVKLIGVKSNRSAIGARVTAHYGGKTQTQEILSQASYYSSNDPRLHFGLGAAATADLDIRWPNGGHESVKAVPAGHLAVIKEGSGLMKLTKFAQASYS
ncbi:MAG TPA: CRTAC1 family protein [Bryobacteraceae bacterium]|nr:CRTAC1 family protein [Bryobacteraceae bacterium]